MKNTDKRKLDYKWVILVVCFLMVFVCLGFCSSNKGLYLAAVTEALGIKRSLFSINDTCRYAATSLINLFLGVLVARFGTRKMVACGFAALTGAMLIYAFAEHIVLFCVGGALLGTGLAFTTGAMVSGIVRQWFDKNIGKYMSIVLCANGVGGALAAQIVSPMINEAGNPFGYRKAYMTVAVILLAVGVLAAVLLRERPNEDGTAPKTATAAKAPATESAPRSGTERFMFGLTAVVVLLTGLILQSTTGVSPAHMKDVGFSAAFIAGAVSLSSLLLTFSKLFVGAMHDRFGLRVIVPMCQLAAVISLAVLALLNASTAGKVLVVVYVVFANIALPLETLVIPLIVHELFGSKNYTGNLGVLTAMNYIGFAIGGPIVNLCYDTFNTYTPALWAFVGIMVLCMVLFFAVLKKAEAKQ